MDRELSVVRAQACLWWCNTRRDSKDLEAIPAVAATTLSKIWVEFIAHSRPVCNKRWVIQLVMAVSIQLVTSLLSKSAVRFNSITRTRCPHSTIPTRSTWLITSRATHSLSLVHRRPWTASLAVTTQHTRLSWREPRVQTRVPTSRIFYRQWWCHPHLSLRAELTLMLTCKAKQQHTTSHSRSPTSSAWTLPTRAATDPSKKGSPTLDLGVVLDPPPTFSRSKMANWCFQSSE